MLFLNVLKDRQPTEQIICFLSRLTPLTYCLIWDHLNVRHLCLSLDDSGAIIFYFYPDKCYLFAFQHCLRPKRDIIFTPTLYMQFYILGEAKSVLGLLWCVIFLCLSVNKFFTRNLTLIVNFRGNFRKKIVCNQWTGEFRLHVVFLIIRKKLGHIYAIMVFIGFYIIPLLKFNLNDVEF